MIIYLTGDIVSAAISALTHPSSATRLAAAWCLRSIAIAVPALLTPLLEKNMENLDKVTVESLSQIVTKSLGH